MTRSIFDPASGETERSGSSFTGPDADQISQMPPDVIDGKTMNDETDEIDMSPDRRPDGPILPGTAGKTQPLDEPFP